MNETRIKIVVPYFGKLPDFTELWSLSLEKNSDIDFLLITDDCTSSFYKAPNLTVTHMEFKEFVGLIKRKVNLKREITPYKLCDFKIAYGDILGDYLSGADYWGFCDIDLIFGNIRKNLQKALSSGFDKILDLGHLSLMKNNQEMNVLYKRPLLGECIFDNVTRSEIVKVFDEMMFFGRGGFNGIVIEQGYSLYVNRKVYADISPGCTSFSDYNNKDRKVLYFEHSRDGLFCHYLDSNGVKRIKEMLYVHFQKRKVKFIPGELSDNFFLSEKGAQPESPDVNGFSNDFEVSPEFTLAKKRNVMKKRVVQAKELFTLGFRK
ncbi:hypothetical protein KUW04_10875 [Halomonas denitrificans]|nr:hypothetical protein [Halomonas denitrificans]